MLVHIFMQIFFPKRQWFGIEETQDAFGIINFELTQTTSADYYCHQLTKLYGALLNKGHLW